MLCQAWTSIPLRSSEWPLCRSGPQESVCEIHESERVVASPSRRCMVISFEPHAFQGWRFSHETRRFVLLLFRSCFLAILHSIALLLVVSCSLLGCQAWHLHRVLHCTCFCCTSQIPRSNSHKDQISKSMHIDAHPIPSPHLSSSKHCALYAMHNLSFPISVDALC